MPYCTIEEAFGTPFEQSNIKDFSEVVPDNAYVDEGDEFSQFRKNEDKKFKRKKQNQHTWSRTLDRLPGHNGPKNRFAGQQNRKELIIEPSSNNTAFPTKKLEDQYEYPENKKTPIDPYDKEVYEELEDEFHNIVEEDDDERLDITTNIASNTNKVIEDKISKLIADNEKLKKYIYDELHKPIYKGDSISDIVLYVLIGIFIIYLLDIFVQLMKTLLLRN